MGLPEDQIRRAYEDLRTARLDMHEVSEKDLAARTTLFAIRISKREVEYE